MTLPAASSAPYRYARPTWTPPAGLVRLDGLSMGTGWTLKLPAACGVPLTRVRAAVEATLAAVVREMSHWDGDSALGRYNRAPAGTWHVLPPAFADVMDEALALAAATGGAYDPTVGPLVAAWGYGPDAVRSACPGTPGTSSEPGGSGTPGEPGRSIQSGLGTRSVPSGADMPDMPALSSMPAPAALPGMPAPFGPPGLPGMPTTSAPPAQPALAPMPALPAIPATCALPPLPRSPDPVALAAARARTGWRRLAFDRPARRLLQPGGVALDLSSIAKGHAVDAVAAAVAALGVESLLVEIGGELRAMGPRPGGGDWRVRVKLPDRDVDAPGPVIALADAAVATSGDDYQHHADAEGRRRSHTLDPRHGRPVEHALASVTVVHARCRRADARATAYAVLGPDDGWAAARAEGVAALFVRRDAGGHAVRMTPAFEALLR